MAESETNDNSVPIEPQLVSVGISISETQIYPLESFLIPLHYIQDLKYVLIPHGMILDRTERIAYEILRDLQGPIMTLCVLKGAYQFYSDLMGKIQMLNCIYSNKSLQMDIDFIRLKSYVDESSTGEIKIIGSDDLSKVKGKHVLVVEDIVDTGRTIIKLLSMIQQYEPLSIKVASLLLKRTESRNTDYIPDYIGFDVPDLFVVGYGMDYNEYFRDLHHICVINNSGKQKYRKFSDSSSDNNS